MLALPPGEHQSQAGSVLPCLYCRLYPLVDGKCQKCGTLCSRCGTSYRGAYCPHCWGEGSDDEKWAQGALGPVAPTPFGDSAPSRSGLSRIIDHAASVKEHNIARGIHVEVVEKMVHDKASAAVEQLDVSREVRTRIMEGVEREAVALWRRARKENKRRLPLEKAIALAFLGQCRGIGRPVEEIQGALARAGFGIRMESVQVTVSSEDPSGVRVLVNGRERGAKITASPKTVRVPVYLSDLLAGGVVEIRVSGNGSTIDVSSPYESERPDWQTVRVNAGRRCFYLFKARKEATISTSEEVRTTALETNVDALLKRLQPSKFPVTATIMDNAGCLRKVAVRFVSP
jgi:hypothetical protein